MAENVKGLRKLIPVLEAEYAKHGYKAYVQLYNSKYWGVPQNRERYYIVGVRNDIAIPFVFPVEQKDFVPKLATILEETVAERYYIPIEKAEKILGKFVLGEGEAYSVPLKFINRNQNVLPEYAICCDVAQTNGVAIRNPEEACRGTGLLNPEGCGKTLRVGGKGSLSKKHNYEHVLEEVKVVIAEATKKGYAEAGIGDSINISQPNSKTRRGRVGVGVAQTLLTGCEQVTIDPLTYRVRKLTPTEYGRLQAFPMNTWKQVVSDSQAYKQFGNAVTTTIPRAIGLALKEQILSQL